jgi:RimJ/RimL family protein N-acetyltransferase
MIIANSERLRYRLMDMQDADLLFEVDQDPQVLKYINGGKVSSMGKIVQTMIPRLQQYLNPEKGWGIWQVNSIIDNEYLGWILVRPMDFFSDSPQWDNLELGWRFKVLAWGKGYATEAAAHLMDALSKDSSINKFCAIAVKENQSSIRIMEKLGMHYIKSYSHTDPLGKWYVDYYERDKKA